MAKRVAIPSDEEKLRFFLGMQLLLWDDLNQYGQSSELEISSLVKGVVKDGFFLKECQKMSKRELFEQIRISNTSIDTFDITPRGGNLCSSLVEVGKSIYLFDVDYRSIQCAYTEKYEITEHLNYLVSCLAADKWEIFKEEYRELDADENSPRWLVNWNIDPLRRVLRKGSFVKGKNDELELTKRGRALYDSFLNLYKAAKE